MCVMDRLCKRWVKLVASLLATDRDLMRFDTAGKKVLTFLRLKGERVVHHVFWQSVLRHLVKDMSRDCYSDREVIGMDFQHYEL